MKNNATLLLMLVSFFFHTNAKAFSQGITLKVTDATLDKVFSLIQKQTNLVFVYSGKQLTGTKKVSVDVTNEKFEKVMQMVMDGQPLKWEVDKEYVIIKVKAPVIVDGNLSKPGELTGRVTNEKGEPVAGATVTVKNSDINAATDPEGYFILKGIDAKSEIVITSIGYEPKVIKLTGEEKITIKMIVSAQTIGVVIVKGSTGYQTIDKDHPGSFDVIDNKLLNRSVSKDILSRIENLTPGISFRNPNDGILIRGRNSIFSNVSPLIVLDNFPYDGDINNINPNDVESVTILKDAAAAAQWGARASNGVIVITTKRGRTSKPLVQYNTNVTITPKPDLRSLPIISSSDYIELEKWLFSKGFYDYDLENIYTKPPMTPVVEILNKQRSGLINEVDANNQINAFKNIDARSDLKKYFYRTAIGLQNSLNVSGVTPNINYFLSIGWDKNKSSVVGAKSDRISVRSTNTFKVTKNLSFDAGISYVINSNTQGNSPQNINSGAGKGLYPYADLVDQNGKALVLEKDYRSSYTDTAGKGNLLDWKYRPYAEINGIENTSNIKDVVLNTGLSYRLNKILAVELKYQYENATNISKTINKVESYDVRNMINTYYQPDPINGDLHFPIPVGDIMDQSISELRSHQGRVQLNYRQNWNSKHVISAIAGWEIKNLETSLTANRIYGYSKKGSIVNPNMDFINLYTLYTSLFTGSPQKSRIINSQRVSEQLDRFISTFANALYEYDNRYFLSFGARKDAANLFGAETNKRGVPLWSAGFAWNLSSEKFFNASWVDNLKIRTSYGYNGNFSRNVTAVTTTTTSINSIGEPAGTIVNPPNKKLRWEQSRIFNIGIDFSIFKDRVFGSVEYYNKNIKDLMGTAYVDPTTGLSNGAGRAILFGNLASMKGHGYEVNITTVNLNNKLRWETNWIFSYAQNKVSEYYIPAPTTSEEFIGAAQGLATPIIGKPLFTIYRYAWAGLDAQNGDPQGVLGKGPSKEYDKILTKTPPDSLVYFGAIQPPYFGAIRNTFTWKNFRISINASYKFNYFFQRASVSYTTLFYTWTGHSDYAKRWQMTGDENRTSVPSLTYLTDPNFSSRQSFYQNSSILIEKGDHIRVEDINISYDLDKSKTKKLPFRQIQIYGYIGNLGLLIWRANKEGIDPYYSGTLKDRMRISVGFNVSFN